MSQQNTEDIGKEILKPTIDLSIDYAEIVLDEFWEEGILKEVPVIKTLISIVKTGLAIRERFFVKRFAVFLRELHTSGLNQEKFNSFKIKFENDSKFREGVVEKLLLLVDISDSTNKSKIIAHLFSVYIEGKYDWDRFLALAICANNLQEYAYDFLQKMSQRKPHGFAAGINLIDNEGEALVMACGIGRRFGTSFTITGLGQDLYQYGISKISIN